MRNQAARNRVRESLRLKTGFEDGLSLDVAIVGAGVSGLYTGWRLMSGKTSGGGSYSPGTVGIFEMGDRIGGRLWSVQLPGMDVVGELGGMRYMTSQEIVTSLIEQVFKDQLQWTDFPMGDNAHLYAYLRTQRLLQSSWTEAQNHGTKLITHYYLNNGDLGFSADQLFNKVVYDVLMADPWFVTNYGSLVSHPSEYDYEFKITARQWDDIKPNLTYCFPGPYEGQKVNDLGFWNLIKDRVGQEGYNFLADAGGYYSNTINWNAAEALPYMVGDFSDASVSYRTIEGGYDLIAYALANAYLSYPGNEIWMENQLLTFERTGGPRKYALTFLDRTSGTKWTVFADSIVLAMPRRSLELLDQENFFFDPLTQQTLQKNIASVIMEPSFKLLMGFEEPWWKEDFGATSGHSITDLPLRQCYYFGTDPANEHSLLLGSYNDMRTWSFWAVLAANPERFTPRITRFAPAAALAALSSVQASKVMIAEAMVELRELHGPQNPIPEPYVSWYRDWTEDPYGGGYHAWNAIYSVKDVMPYMRQPDPNEAIHVCGEAYSDQQGWVEGAFCVAEKMLQEHYGLVWPSWLDPDYYLGW